MVPDAAQAAGYEAHSQVGWRSTGIDIGIIHPDKPGNYIIGLECDVQRITRQDRRVIATGSGKAFWRN